MATTSFNWENLRQWVQGQNAPQEKTASVTVRRSDLAKVGGLYRIRDNYEEVWKLEAGEDGRSYIVRLGEDGAEERLLVAEEDSAENYSKAAYRTLVGGQVHIVWECESCSAPNITKEGNSYECDDCHKQYPEVLSAHPQPEVYDRSTAAQFGDWVVERMKREGISKINKNLIQVWEKEAEEADPPDEPGQKLQQAGSKKCKSCGKKMSGSSILSKCSECIDKE